MQVEQEVAAFRKYLLKLRNLISRDNLFAYGDNKIVDKKKVDDLLCCIEASFPVDIIKKEKTTVQKLLRSKGAYKELLNAIKNRFLFSNSVYLVHYSDAIARMDALMKAINQDLDYIYNQDIGT